MRILLLLITLFGINSLLLGQTLKGIIVDEAKIPIQGVNILNKATDQHTHSNEEGAFVFENLSVGDTLDFTSVSYKNVRMVIEDLSTPLYLSMDMKLVNIDEVIISPKVNALHLISNIDIKKDPVNSSQDILRKVPGLFIGQHAGGGKAEQMFLRGFDIDHGTDINVTVDGLPVNMVSHAHGQGYADLHFVIPETIGKIDFGKGPYYADKGNFNTAGYANFLTKQKLDNSSIKFEAGQFNTYRMLGLFNVLNQPKDHAYIATEHLSTDGPFISPQNFNRTNLFGKYVGVLSNTDRFGVSASYFTSKWDASGQIPERAIADGSISRFDAIDDTEGGSTSRSNLLINYDKIIDENSTLKSSVYLSHYDFELFSNFTFFLEDPVNGDQIKQKEDRTIYGFNSEFNQNFSFDEVEGTWQLGILLRNDQSRDNELSHTVNRSETLEYIQLGDVNETNAGAYLGTSVNWKKWTFNPSVRIDVFDFQYNDVLLAEYQTQTQTKAIVSPKFNILYNQSNQFQLYLKTGKGFHSNDTRVVLEQNDKILPGAYGGDLGFILKPTPKMFVNLAYWYLYLEQEFVYVGDAGIVEPSGETRRQGLDLSYRYQPLPWLYWNLDANYTLARAIGEPSGEDYIPLAPDFTLVTGISVLHESGTYGGVNLRHLGDRPANEDNSIVAKGYTVTDLNVGYQWKSVNVGIQIQNLFDVEWNETQFATESRLQNETEPVEEIHFTPGTPFFIKSMIEFKF